MHCAPPFPGRTFRGGSVVMRDRKAPHAVQEAHDAAQTAVIELAARFIWAHEQQVRAESIGAVAPYVHIRIDRVAMRLADLGARRRDDAVGAKARERLLELQVAQLVHRNGDEARIHQMQDTMLRAPNVHPWW